jgi:hypothetical protein
MRLRITTVNTKLILGLKIHHYVPTQFYVLNRNDEFLTTSNKSIKL